MLAALLAAYGRALAARPTLTKTATAAGIAGAGDAGCQALDGGAFDGARTARFASWALVSTPLVARWYAALAARWPTSAARRVLADQLLWAPPATAVMLAFLGAADGGGAVSRLRSSFLPTLSANWMVWPLVQSVNFALVPPQYNILFTNVIGLGWSVALSRLANAPTAPGTAPPPLA